MERCMFCNKEFDGTNRYNLGKNVYVCRECAEQVDTWQSSTNREEIHQTQQYLKNCLSTCKNTKMQFFINDIIHTNKKIVINPPINRTNNDNSISERDDIDKKIAINRTSSKDMYDYQTPSIAKTFVTFAFAIWIIGLLTGIIVAFTTKMGNGIVLFIGIFGGSLIAGCMPYAIASIIDYLAHIDYTMNCIKDKINQ